MNAIQKNDGFGVSNSREAMDDSRRGPVLANLAQHATDDR